MTVSPVSPSQTREALAEPRFRLADDFPVLSRLIGDPRLARLEADFRDFLRRLPEGDAGRRLPVFLAGLADLGDRPVLTELAAFEWALAAAARAPAEAPLPPEELDQLPAEAWPGLRLAFNPSLERIDTEWNSVPLWRAVREETEPPLPTPLPATRTWAVWRQNGRTRFRPLPPDDAWALDLAVRGYPFGEISRALCRWLPPREAAPFATRMVGDWLDSGWITELRTAAD
ncbi:MAG TPA: hypothetical protein VKA55_10120 [Gammaproteobacteria bacterium]|nr:hypothetical protein [Gammaproteobacteria bacterium]